MYIQDGLGFGGQVCPNPIGDTIDMLLYNSCPVAGFTRGHSAFAGGVFDGSSVWMLPFPSQGRRQGEYFNGQHDAVQ